MNKIVFLLPTSVMLILFFFGYQYINQSGEVTNEQLQHSIMIDLDQEVIGHEVRLKGSWDWTRMPADGLVGTDYIGISIQNNDGSLVSASDFGVNSLSLLKGKQILYKSDGEIVHDGVVFTFPNVIIDHESHGNKGEIELVFTVSDKAKLDVVTFTYVHTWKDHSDIEVDDAFLTDENFEEELHKHFWSVKRFLSFQGM